MSVQDSPYVFLKVDDFIVGTGKYFLHPQKCRKIDGEDLARFSKDGEDLVAIYHVHIYCTYEKLLYPYLFGGPEDPPKYLSEMNVRNQSFKRIIAWNDKALTPNLTGTDLGDMPVQENRPSTTSRVQDTNGSQASPAGEPLFFTESGEVSGSEESLQIDQISRSVRDTVSVVIDENQLHSPGVSEENMGPSSLEVADSGPLSDLGSEGEVQAVEAVDEMIRDIIEDCSPEEAEWREAALKEKRRTYTYRKRKKAPNKALSSLRKRRVILSRREDNPFLHARHCCQSLQCFATLDAQVSFEFYKKTLSLSQEARKEEIARLLDWKTRTIHLDGRPVCATFLDKGFRISRCLQATITGTDRAKSTPLPFRLPRETRRKTMKDRIINYLRLLAGEYGQHMPHESRTNLPFPRRGDVYDGFKDYLARGDEDGEINDPPTRAYFNRIWRKYVPHATVRRHHDFTVCARCEWLRSKIVACYRKRSDTLMFRLKRELREHISAMKAERRSYDERKMLAINHPTQYCSIVVDGADQKNYGLPHFAYSVKTDRGNAIKVKCVGVLEHLKNKRLSLFTMTEEFESGANHVIECIHRVLQKKKVTNKKLPPVLFIQMDNCTREKKNRYMMCYLESLVAAGVFTEVQVSFLPIGHTHSDIDQAFGCVARRLLLVDAATMEELLSEMRQSYSPKATASEVLRVANFSGLCEESKCVQAISGFSEFRYFRFIRAETTSTDDSYQTACNVKRYLSDPWTELERKVGSGGVFMKSLPDFSHTPNTISRIPDDVEEIEKRISSVEGRVEDPKKIQELVQLKNRIYESRSDCFHWNTNACFELNGDYRQFCDERDQEGEESESSDDDAENANLNYDYVENEFVAVKPPNDASEPFWIAKVISIHKRDQFNQANKLLVRWFSPNKTTADLFTVCYSPSFRLEGEVRVPYSAVLHVNTVMVKFQSLTSKKKLYMDTQRNIRDSLNNM